MTGWSIQYTSATGTGNLGSAANLITEIPTVTLAPGQYLLIQEATNAAVGAPLPSPFVTDATPIAMSATAGKVALVSTTAPLGCNGGSNPCSAAALASIVDLVGFGGANFFEGAAAPAPSNTTAIFRDAAGCTDTDNNAADFANNVAPNSPAPPSPRNTASPFNVCGGGDTAPSVVSTSPAGGATNVTVSSNITVTFSEAVNASAASFNISCGAVTHTAAVSGGPTAFTLDPDTNFANGATCTVTVLAAQVEDQDTSDPPDNMTADYQFSFTTAAADPCASAYTPIPQIQGSGPASLMANSVVTTKGVVTGDFQGSAGLNGFFIQDAAGDGDPATSDGIFVFVPAANPFSGVDVAPGDVVTLRGRVVEFNTLTEMDNLVALSKCGTAPVPATTVVSLPEPVNNDLERFEGMLVHIPETMTVGQTFFLGRFGQATLSSDGRLYTPTNLYPAGSPQAIAQADENARRLLVLDDGFGGQNPATVPYAFGPDQTLRGGDTVTGLTGVIDFGSINSNSAIRDYRLHPTVAPAFTRDNPRTAAPSPVGGNAKVASMNVLNYFNGNGTGGGFPTSRGATSLAEFNRQRAKTIAALSAIDADVVGLIEIENDGGGPTSAIQDLVNGLNAAMGAGTYAAVVGPDPGTDEIQTAFIYKPARVTPVGAAANDPNPVFQRQPLAQTFSFNQNGERFSVVVNHFKSKGSCPASASDPNADQGDGQGCWNAQRVQQAQALLAFIGSVQAAAGDDDVLVIGDLNAYAKEDPILALVNGGLTDMAASLVGAEAYSYVFDGQAGYLDHALATSTLVPQVTGVTEWHINADEPSVIDYNLEFKPQDLYQPSPYRSADHDPVVVGLNLNAAPTAAAGGPYTVAEGGSVTVSATGADADNDALTFDWDLDNDGSFETLNQQAATFSAAGLDGPATQTVNVRVTDAGGRFDTASATVTVTNAAPVVGALTAAPSTVATASPVSASASFTDAGVPDTHTATINWGDGNTTPATVTGAAGSGSAAASHAYTAPGTYTVTLTVTDDDGDSHASSTTVTVEAQYGVLPLYDQAKVHKSGSTIPVKLQVLDGDGNNVSSPGLVVNALGISQVSNATAGDLTETSSTANPDNNFRYDASLAGYIFNLRTKGLAAGTYYLYFRVGADPTLQVVSFQVR